MGLFGPGVGYRRLALTVSGAGLLLILACGTSAAPTVPPPRDAVILPGSTLSQGMAPPVSPEAESVESVPVPATIGPATIGNNLGQRIPDFAIQLVDGSSVTSADLLAQRQPTFLFFFETW